MISTISQLIALVESGNCASAIRYEPNWRYITPELIQRCIRAHAPAYMNETTARALMMFSYGKCQIMGSVLYELGYKGKLSDFQVNTTLQEAWFDEFITARKIRYSLDEIVMDETKRLNFAKKYNGDAAGYSAKLLKMFKDWSK